MKTITLKQLNAINTFSELKELFPSATYEVGGRGGHVGIDAERVAIIMNVPLFVLPSNVGAFTNYLGGGMRGAIQTSNFSPEVGKHIKKLDALCDACKRVYNDIENEGGLNDDIDEFGVTNWDALATAAARNAGINSAY